MFVVKQIQNVSLGGIFIDISFGFEYVRKVLLFVLLGKKDKLRVYYLSWLRNKILHNDPEVEKKQGWTTVGDLEGCVHYKVGKFRGGHNGIVSPGLH